jgi:hypothetical protein
MTTRLTMALAVLVVGSAGALARAQAPAPAKGGNLADYLAPDGKLRAALEVRDVKGGFGVFAGLIYHIDPDGRWTTTEIFRRQPFVRGQGQLGKKELRQLAGALVQYDLLGLPSGGAAPRVNPHALTISFGGKAATLTLGVDQVPVRPAPGDPAPGLVGRYGGISGAVRGLLGGPAPGGVPAR